MMTATQLAAQYRVHLATIGRAIEKARLPKARGTSYSSAQVAAITAYLPAHTPTTTQPDDALLTRIERLESLVASLQQENRELRAKQATHDYLLQVLCNWSKNTARIIRALWRRMPDYAPGDTPAEFPAVRLDAIGREELAAQRAIEQDTRAFFAEMDRKETSDDE